MIQVKGQQVPGHRVWSRLSDDRHEEGVTGVCGILREPCVGSPRLDQDF